MRNHRNGVLKIASRTLINCHGSGIRGRKIVIARFGKRGYPVRDLIVYGGPMDHIRIWSEVDIGDIESHIVFVDDKFGFCPGCKELGIKIEGLRKCPKCGRKFTYVTARESKGPKGLEMIARIIKKLPHLTFVDYDDYERATGKKKAAGLFNGI